MTTFDPAYGQVQSAGGLWRVQLNYGRALSEDEGQALFAAFEEIALSVLLHNKDCADGNDWEVTLITQGAPDLDALHALADSQVPLARDQVTAAAEEDQDWLCTFTGIFRRCRSGVFSFTAPITTVRCRRMHWPCASMRPPLSDLASMKRRAAACWRCRTWPMPDLRPNAFSIWVVARAFWRWRR